MEKNQPQKNKYQKYTERDGRMTMTTHVQAVVIFWCEAGAKMYICLKKTTVTVLIYAIYNFSAPTS